MSVIKGMDGVIAQLNAAVCLILEAFKHGFCTLLSSMNVEILINQNFQLEHYLGM